MTEEILNISDLTHLEQMLQCIVVLVQPGVADRHNKVKKGFQSSLLSRRTILGRDNFKVRNILAASSFHSRKTATVCMLFAIFGALKIKSIYSACQF